jgi:hypothetical protein
VDLKTYYKLIDEMDKYRGYGVHTGVEEVAAKFEQPYDATRAIRSQYLQRKSIKNHYKVKDKAGLHYNTWKDGRSISEIALDVDFPPILLANFLMLKMRYSKKRTKEIIKDTNLIKGNERLKEELDEVIGRDELYTPRSHSKQSAEGNRREDLIAKWLDEKKLEYFTEDDLRAGTVEGKTPDFLLLKPMSWHGDEYNWIESKASFGDEYIHRKNHRGQVSKYVELYGQGILVYWYGYLDSLQSKGYTIIDRKEMGLK